MTTTPRPRTDPGEAIFQAAGGYIVSACLWVATELKIADLVARGPKSLAELARATHTEEHALGRILRVLAMFGIFTEPSPNTFAISEAAEMLRSDVARSMHDSVLWMCDPLHFSVHAELMYSVKTGVPAIEKVTGKPAFEMFRENAIENQRFNAAMTNMTANQVAAILDVYDFSAFETIVDVAGGHGYLLCEILKKYPNLKGMLFDLDHVLQGAAERIRVSSLNGRCRSVAGNFFDAIPEGGDLYVMKLIIHDWNNERASKILTNCRKALASGKDKGKLLLFEMVRPADNSPHLSKLLDVEMLLFPGGQERTQEQYRQLFADNGFRLARIIPTRSPISILEAEVA